MTDITLSIIFPAYNEAGRIETAVDAARAYIEKRQLAAEIIVVDDGSTDDTLKLANRAAEGDDRIRVLTHQPNRGKGFAVKRGMTEATGRCRVFLDVDLATPLKRIDDVLPLFADGADIVIGSRRLPESQIQTGHGLLRTWMSNVFHRIALLLLPLRVSDITCGFKAVRGAVADEIFSVQNEYGWAFDAELIYVARKWQLDLRQIPVNWTHSGDSSVRVLPAAFGSMASLLRIRRHDRRGAYVRPRNSDGA